MARHHIVNLTLAVTLLLMVVVVEGRIQNDTDPCSQFTNKMTCCADEVAIANQCSYCLRITVDDTAVKCSDYVGTVSHTVSGRRCQRWDSQTPHRHPYSSPGQFPDGVVPDNYCRVVSGDPGATPWCHTTDPHTRWERCDTGCVANDAQLYTDTIGCASTPCADEAELYCYSIQACTTNPCANGGVCAMVSGSVQCDCGGTGYEGDTCQDVRKLYWNN